MKTKKVLEITNNSTVVLLDTDINTFHYTLYLSQENQSSRLTFITMCDFLAYIVAEGVRIPLKLELLLGLGILRRRTLRNLLQNKSSR